MFAIRTPWAEYRSWCDAFNPQYRSSTQENQDASNRRIACYAAMIFAGFATLAVGAGCFLAGCTFAATALALCPALTATILFHDLYQKYKAQVNRIGFELAIETSDNLTSNWKKTGDEDEKAFADFFEAVMEPHYDTMHKGRNGQFSAAELKAREDALYENTLVWKHLRKYLSI
jgi:hypothetical protein